MNPGKSSEKEENTGRRGEASSVFHDRIDRTLTPLSDLLSPVVPRYKEIRKAVEVGIYSKGNSRLKQPGKRHESRLMAHKPVWSGLRPISKSKCTTVESRRLQYVVLVRYLKLV